MLSRAPVRRSYLEELRLTQFKSFWGTTLPMSEFTLLIGRNGSGKSNALDALVVLARLASGDDTRDALDGTRNDQEPVRGGAEGCAPWGQDTFSLGCRVRSGEDAVDFDVTVQVRPDVRIVSERLVVHGGFGTGRASLVGKELLASEDPNPDSADLWAKYYNGKRGVNPGTPFTANRLLICQVPARVPAQAEATRLVHRAAALTVAALREVFVLDPVPALMRQYVNERDNVLRRDASNLSAVVARLRREDPDALNGLLDVVKDLSEQPVRKIDTSRSDLGDVLLVLHERHPGDRRALVRIPARQMSDGTLRFLAIGTAVLSAPPLDFPSWEDDPDAAQGQRTLVVEEIESGLYPSQAATVLNLVKHETAARQVRTVATTHSPAILDALTGSDHESVLVCDRDPSGSSRLRRLVDLPGYPELMAADELGSAIAHGRLAEAARPRDRSLPEFDRFIKAL